MTLINPPAWLQQGSYSASLDRSVIAGLFRTGGVVDESHFVVTQTATPSLRLNVSAGHAYIEGTSVQNQGYYHIFNDAIVEVEFNPGSLSLGRIDLLVLRILDADVAGSINEARFEVIQGTPATIPSVPVRPPSSIELARVTVNPGTSSTSGIVNSSINSAFKQLAAFSSGLVQSPRMVTSTTRPTTAPVGTTIYETDTWLTRVKLASGLWRHVGGHPTFYADRVTGSFGNDWNLMTGFTSKIDDLNALDLATGRFLNPIDGVWRFDVRADMGTSTGASAFAVRISTSTNAQFATGARDYRNIQVGSQFTQTAAFSIAVNVTRNTALYGGVWHNFNGSQGVAGLVFTGSLVRATDA